MTGLLKNLRQSKEYPVVSRTSELQQGTELDCEGSDVGSACEIVLIGGDVGGQGGLPYSR